MKICAALVPDGQATAAAEPSERVRDNPAMAPEPPAPVDAASRQTRCAPSLAPSGAAEAMVIGFIAMGFIRPAVVAGPETCRSAEWHRASTRASGCRGCWPGL